MTNLSPGAARRAAIFFSALIGAALPLTTVSQSLEELVVTARKQEESLQEVPISVTAFSAAQIQNIGANSNDDISYATVNFNTVGQLGRRLDRPVIRGMAAPSTFGEPNASYFIDGSYVSGSISNLTMGPIERVEILRGPQSAQFGRATFSGAVNYVTRKPSNDYTGEALMRVGNKERTTISGWASGPMIEDTLLYFVSAGYDHYGGNWKNNLKFGQATQPELFIGASQEGDSSDIGGTETSQIEGKLLWNISDTQELTFKAGYIHGDDDHHPQLIVEIDELNCYVPGVHIMPGDPTYTTSPGAYCGPLKSKGRDTRLNLPDIRSGMTSGLVNFPAPGTVPEDWISEGEEVGLRRDTYNTQINYVQNIGEWNLTTKAAWNKTKFDNAYDLDHNERRSFIGLFHFYQEQERKDQSLEIRLASPVDERLRGTFGFYYYDFEQDNRQHANVGLAQGPLSATTTSTTDNIAFFGSAEFDISSKLTIAIEARAARDTKEITSPNFCDDIGDPYFSPGKVTHKVETDSLTPRFTLRYFATDDAMLYVQAAKGNKPGNFNNIFYNDGADGCSTQAQFFESGGFAYVDEEKSWNYEIGAKTSWFENRLTANIALFYIDWDNQTVFETRNVLIKGFGVPSSVGINAGKSRVYGMEIETAFAFTDNLTGSLGYGLTDGEFKEFESGALKSATGDGDASGNTIPNSPKHNVVASLSYVRSANADLDWFVRTDYTFESSRYTSGTNFTEIDNRRRWNVRTGIESADWKFSLFVNNILDEQTPSAILGFPRIPDRAVPSDGSTTYVQGYALTPTPGLSWGAELIRRFGD